MIISLPQLKKSVQEKWLEARKGLGNRRRTVEADSQPYVTRTTALVVAFTSAYPLALVVLAGAVRTKDPWAWWQWLALAYAIFPVLLAMGLWFWLGQRRADVQRHGARNELAGQGKKSRSGSPRLGPRLAL